MKTILCVDDIPEILEVYKGILEVEYNVLTAANDTGVFEILKNHNPEVVTLDLNLGSDSLGGIEICKQINTRWSGIKVIMISGMVYENPSCFIGCNFSAYLAKPVAASELLRVVGELCDMQDGRYEV